MTRRILCGVFAALALAGAAFAAEQSIEHYLPADGILSVCYYGDNPDVEKTAFAQLLKEPEVAEWLTSVRTAIGGANQFIAAALRVNPALLRPLLGCRLGLALLPPAGQGGPPALVIVARVGAAGNRARDQVSAFLKQAIAAAGGVAPKLKVGGIEVTQLGEGPASLCFGLRGDFLFLSSSRAALERTLAPGTPKLAANASFQRATAAKGSPVALLLYDHAAVMERFGGAMPREARALFAALGLNGVRSVGLRIGAKGRALVGTLLVHTAGERRGLVRTLAATPVDQSLLRQAPRDAAFAWIHSVDPGELYDTVVAAIDAVAGRGQATAAIAEFGKRAGLDLRADLFGSLTRGCLVTTSGKSLLPALVVSQGLKDGDRFDAAMQKLVAQLDGAVKAEWGDDAGATLRSIRFGQHTIRYLAAPGLGVPVAPCYARRGDRVVFALSPIHLKDYLAFLDAGEPSLLDNPRYTELAALVPKNATSVAYSDFGEAFVAGYSILGPFLTLAQAIPNNPVPLDLANLPAVRTIRKHMFASVSYSYATDDTIVAETVSPLGVGAMDPVPAAFVLGVGAGIALPAMASARGAARQAASMSNMRQLTVAMMMFANNFNGTMPANIAALFDAKLIEAPHILVAPNDPDPPKVGGRPCSYVYFLDDRLVKGKVRLQDFDDPGRTPVLWERRPFRRGRRAVAFADGHVEMMTEPAFRAALERLDRALKGKLKGGEL